MVSIPACHAGDRGSIPRRGDFFHYPFYNPFIIHNLIILKYDVKSVLNKSAGKISQTTAGTMNIFDILRISIDFYR